MLLHILKLLICLLMLIAPSVYGQTVVCGGKTVKADPTRTIFGTSNGCKSCGSYILNDKALDFKKPGRPYEPQRRKSSGAVSINVLIDKKGRVERVDAVYGPQILRQISVDAVKRTTFKRLIFDCRPRKYSGTFTINYPPE